MNKKKIIMILVLLFVLILGGAGILYKQLGQKLMNGEITPEEHVKEYNRLLKEMSEKYDSQWRPHEHI